MTKAQERQLSGFVFAAWILAHPASSIVSPEPTVNNLAPSFYGAGGFVRPLPSLYVSGYVATHWPAQQYACSEPALVFPALSGDSRTALWTIGTLMKTQKRFTPDLLDRFRRLGRGKGRLIDSTLDQAHKISLNVCSECKLLLRHPRFFSEHTQYLAISDRWIQAILPIYW